MYKMKADGVVFYDPSSDDMALHVLSPKAKYELNKAGSVTFTMLPGNVMYDGLHKMKTIITLEQDGEVIFRGRVLETTTDTFNQRKVYCEGELAYLLDSLVRPYEFEGKASDLFKQLVAKHNEQVDDYKRFEVGIITAVTDEDETETDSDAYTDTLAELRQMLINPFGGYLRIRVENGVRYLDYIKEYDDECGQAIEFGVNLVDVENKLDASDVFSVLVPLGDYNTESKNDPITIESVNGGKDYLEDEEAIAKYGRIVKTYKWEELTDPQEIMDKGLEHFEKMKAKRTLTIKAVDLHIIDASVESIRLGHRVRLISSPHGLNEPDICSVIDLDIEKPEESEYTFGEPQKSLTDSNAARNKQYATDMNHTHKWLKETDNSLQVVVDKVNGLILLQADYVTIKAFETVIEGLVKVDELAAKIAEISMLGTGGIHATGSIQCESVIDGEAVQGRSVFGEDLSCVTLSINGADFAPANYVTTSGLSGTLGNYATRSWVLERDYATVSDVSAWANDLLALESRVSALEAKS